MSNFPIILSMQLHFWTLVMFWSFLSYCNLDTHAYHIVHFKSIQTSRCLVNTFKRRQYKTKYKSCNEVTINFILTERTLSMSVPSARDSEMLSTAWLGGRCSFNHSMYVCEVNTIVLSYCPNAFFAGFIYQFCSH